MRIAIVHDWLFRMRGGEFCLEEICKLFPKADIYTLFLDRRGISAEIASHRIVASSFNSFPGVAGYYRYLLPFYFLPIAELSAKIRQEKYDLVISVSHCVAKNVKLDPQTPHLCYCLTPARYLWDQHEQYFGRSPLRILAAPIFSLLRFWDRRSAKRVTRFVGISQYIADRIKRVYGTDAGVIYPPVRDAFLKAPLRNGVGEDYFVVVNALVPYKRTDIIIEAFNKMRLPLLIIGNGPEEARLRRIAGPTVSFRRSVSEEELIHHYSNAKALIFAAEEDFGLTPVEAQAVGTPVIFFDRGGAAETVCGFHEVSETTGGTTGGVGGGGATGVGYKEQTPSAVELAVRDFLSRIAPLPAENCRQQAAKFSVIYFQERLLAEVRKMVPGGLAPGDED